MSIHDNLMTTVGVPMLRQQLGNTAAVTCRPPKGVASDALTFDAILGSWRLDEQAVALGPFEHEEQQELLTVHLVGDTAAISKEWLVVVNVIDSDSWNIRSIERAALTELQLVRSTTIAAQQANRKRSLV